MTVIQYLNEHHSKFRVSEHKHVFTADQLATVEHIPARQVAKAVVVREDGKYVVCVLPADRKIDIYALQKHFRSDTVELASEQELERLFADSELGAEPPFGNLYNLPTLMDKSLAKDKEIVFFGGKHEQSVWISMKEYKKLAKPEICSFSYATSLDEIESMPFDPFFYDPYGL
jgi:Ala-tRNA(Pro) deacylase